MMVYISKSGASRSRKVIILFNKGLMKLHPEYWFQFRDSQYSRNIDKIERLQRRITKTVRQLQHRTQRKGWRSCACLAWREEEMGMGNIAPLFYSQTQVTGRTRLFVTVKEEQLQMAPMEITMIHQKNGSYREWFDSGASVQRRCGISTLGDLQNSSEDRSVQPDLTLKLALPWAGIWTRCLSGVPYKLIFLIFLWFCLST